MAEVIVRKQNQEIGRFPLRDEGATLFGRPHASAGLEQPTIVLDAPEVSRTQCHVVGQGGVWTVFDGWPGDRGSANGTWVNGQRISGDGGQGLRLSDGDQVEVPHPRTPPDKKFQLVFEGVGARDEKTKFVGEDDLDEKTAFVDEGAPEKDYWVDQDKGTFMLLPKAELACINAIPKAAVADVALDELADPKSIVFRGKVFDLSKAGRVTVGRASDCRIILVEPDPKVRNYISRYHAEIEFHEADQQYYLVNQSPNGTWVNRQLAYTQQALANGDEIGIGSTVMRFDFSPTRVLRAPIAMRRPKLVRALSGLAAVAFIGGLAMFAFNWYNKRVPEELAARERWSRQAPERLGTIWATPALADLNRDGALDVVMAGSGTVWALDGRQGGQLWNRTFSSSQLGSVVGPVAIVDVDRDGELEVVAAGGSVEVLSGRTGTRKWQHVSGEGNVNFVSGVAFADLDGNGFLDIVTSGAEGPGRGYAVALRGETGGVLWRSSEDTEIVAMVPPALADFNRDGISDVVYVARNSGNVEVLDGRSGARYWTMQVTDRNELMSAPAVAEMTGDGVPDVVVLTPDYQVLLLDGQSGTVLRRFSMRGSMFVPKEVGNLPFTTAPVLADVNGDGDLDVIVPHFGNGEGTGNFVYAVDGSNFTTALWTYPTGDRVAIAPPSLADLDRDGAPEVMVMSWPWSDGWQAGQAGRFEVLDGRFGRVRLSWNLPQPAVPSTHATTLVADVDGDRLFDLVTTDVAGAVTLTSLNVPCERGAVAWGSQRRDPANLGVYEAVPQKSDTVLLSVSGGAVVFGLLLGLLSGGLAALGRRWKQRGPAWERETAASSVPRF